VAECSLVAVVSVQHLNVINDKNWPVYNPV